MFANQAPAVWARAHKNGCTNTLKQAKLHSQLRHHWVQTKHKHLNKRGGSFPRRPAPPPRLTSTFFSHTLKHKYTWMPWHQLHSSVLIKSCLLNQCAVGWGVLCTCCSSTSLITADFHINFRYVHTTFTSHTHAQSALTPILNWSKHPSSCS